MPQWITSNVNNLWKTRIRFVENRIRTIAGHGFSRFSLYDVFGENLAVLKQKPCRSGKGNPERQGKRKKEKGKNRQIADQPFSSFSLLQHATAVLEAKTTEREPPRWQFALGSNSFLFPSAFCLILRFFLFPFSFSYAHHIAPAFSRRMISFRSATAFVRPSFTLRRLSSCSIEITPS